MLECVIAALLGVIGYVRSSFHIAYHSITIGDMSITLFFVIWIGLEKKFNLSTYHLDQQSRIYNTTVILCLYSYQMCCFNLIFGEESEIFFHLNEVLKID